MANDRRCLFCLDSDGKFASREHIFPETVGNADLAMLPPGIICDRCNNGPLSRLDKALCDYLPIAMRRATLGIPNKKGAAATVRFAEGRIEPLPAEAVASGDSHGVRFVDQNPRRPTAHSFEQHDDHVAFKVSGQGGRRLTEKYFAELSRAVLKIAFECAYLDHGDELFASRFDYVRGVVLGQRDHHGEIALALNGDGEDVRMQCSYMLDDATGIGGAVVNVLGVVVVAHAADQPIAPTPGFFIGGF
jgi:hypothetical protein